jgi:hypothetical protein
MKSAIATAILTMFLTATGYATDRALIVGIEKYKNLSADEGTPGCVEDARAMEKFIRENYQFTEIKMLLNEEATAANIERQFREWLIAGTQPGDRVFFFYAGHGSQLPDDNGDETDDRRDETLAPYDVVATTGANMIRDDVFDEMIAKLSGRRAVLVFDSCHSGSISRGTPKFKDFKNGGGVRYLPSPDQLEKLKTAGTRGPNDGYIVSGGQGGSRDLVNEGDFIDPARFAQTSGIVIISAAGDRQQAFPLLVSNQYRGALSYLLAQEHQGGRKPTVQELREALKSRILRLQNTGALDGHQQPVLTTKPAQLLESKPLFATWQEAPMIALVNPLSTITLRLGTRERKTAYRIGENIGYQVETSVDGYLYLIVFSQNNVASCIFPNSEDLNNEVPAGVVKLPRSGTYEFPIEEPVGRDVAVAILSKQKLNLGEKVLYTWQEVFDRLNLKELQTEISKTAMRGTGVKKTGVALSSGDWQGAFMVLETLPK